MPPRFLFILFICSFLTFTSLDAQLTPSSPMPPDFTCQGILLVEKFKDKTTIYGYEQAVKKKFPDYKGNYILATEKEVRTDSLYSDKKTYRFFLRVKWDQVMETAHGQLRMAGKWRSYFFEDRETGKIYTNFAELKNTQQTVENMLKILNASCK